MLRNRLRIQPIHTFSHISVTKVFSNMEKLLSCFSCIDYTFFITITTMI
jgi:hypothetical protein